eukprot:m51a1_g7434 hypothetical protein (486) ;mRNA; r:51912-53707
MPQSPEHAPLLAQPTGYSPSEIRTSIERESTYYKSDFAAYSVAINYIIGAGVLGVPYAFYVAGVPLTGVTLAFFAVFLVLGCMWVIEIMSRAKGYEAVSPSVSGSSPRYTHDFDRCSYTHFCYLWGGHAGKFFSEAIIACYCYGCLWAYVATFSSSLAMLMFEFVVGTETCDIYEETASAACHATYYGCCGVFALIVLGLTLLDITEQQGLQVALTLYRFVAFALMLGTVGVGLAHGGPQQHADSDPRGLWRLKWSGFGVMFPSAAVALNVHYNLADALAPLRNKRKSPFIAAAAQLTSLAFYVAVGASCAVFFNPPRPLVTLNWAGYTGRDGGWGEGPAHWWATAIQLAIVLFPVIDLTNVYPLVAITLSGNLAVALPESLARRRVLVRMMAAVLPLVLGTLVGRLDTIFTIAGMFGFAIEFVVPPVFQWLSRRACVRRWGKGSDVTPFTGTHSGPVPVWVTFAVGIAAFAFSILATACPSCVE